MSHLAIFALGPLRIELDSQAIQTSRHKAQAMMVYLAMNPGKHSRSLLSALLWPEFSQDKAYSYLRRTLWEMKSILGAGWIEADHGEIGFLPDISLYLDVAEFHNHLARISQHPHPTTESCADCITRLHTVASLYRGDFLSGFSLRDSDRFEDWQVFQAEILRREYAGALQTLVAMLLRDNSLNEALVFCQRWLALDNLNEEVQRQMMKIYVLNGDRSQALRQFQECERLLKTELGVPPEPATISLHEQILSGAFMAQLDPRSGSGEAALPAPAAYTEKPAISLPVPSTPFLGRQQELEQISELLANPNCWLVTLLGPGGIGKTRLALEAGRQQAANFPQGVFFVPLAAAETSPSVAPAIASAIGLTLRQNDRPPEEQLLDFLAEKKLLLILDSFERLVQSSALLGSIHFRAKDIKVIITTRHRLPMQSAWVVEVKGLHYPEHPPQTVAALQDYTASALFLNAAHRTRTDFQVAAADIPAITQVLHSLEGMPLGLELAAVWVKTLSCTEIAEEINHSLDFLENSAQDLPERQRSIRAVFDHSWRLMSSREQRLLPRLSVFEGIFDRRAAEQVAGINLRELAGLVDQSLVQRTPDGFFLLHDLLRQYTRKLLEKSPNDDHETRSRHCAVYCSRLAEWNRNLAGYCTWRILREIEIHLPNLQSAWKWAIRHRKWPLVEQALDGMCMFYLRCGRFAEGSAACETVVAIPGKDPTPQLRAKACAWLGIFSINLEKFEEAGCWLRQGQELLESAGTEQAQSSEMVLLLTARFLLANLQADPAVAVLLCQSCLDLSLKVAGKAPRFFVYFWRFLMSGNVSAELYSLLVSILEAVRAAGDPFELACLLFTLGIGEAFHTFRVERAEPLLRECCDIFQAMDDPVSRVMIFKTMGYLHIIHGEFSDILMLRQQEMDYFQEIGDHRMMGISHAEIGEALTHLGRYAEAETELRTALALAQGWSELEFAHRHRYLGDVFLAQDKVEEACRAYEYSFHFFQAAGHKGWIITALTGLSRTALALGNGTEAWAYTRQALQLYAGIRIFTFFIYLTLAQAALLHAGDGDFLQAAELYFLACRQAYLARSAWFADLYGKPMEEALAHLSMEEVDAIRDRVSTLEFSAVIEPYLLQLA
ncbi:MAG: hypothetical protein HPY85_08855 [Anaerolineae bacterium]|nr:hypothetical protein [Anaerolineae bacterium]